MANLLFFPVLANLQFASHEYQDLQSEISITSLSRIKNADTHHCQIANSAERGFTFILNNVGTYFMYVRPPRNTLIFSDIHKVCPYAHVFKFGRTGDFLTTAFPFSEQKKGAAATTQMLLNTKKEEAPRRGFLLYVMKKTRSQKGSSTAVCSHSSTVLRLWLQSRQTIFLYLDCPPQSSTKASKPCENAESRIQADNTVTVLP